MIEMGQWARSKDDLCSQKSSFEEFKKIFVDAFDNRRAFDHYTLRDHLVYYMVEDLLRLGMLSILSGSQYKNIFRANQVNVQMVFAEKRNENEGSSRNDIGKLRKSAVTR